MKENISFRSVFEYFRMLQPSTIIACFFVYIYEYASVYVVHKIVYISRESGSFSTEIKHAINPLNPSSPVPRITADFSCLMLDTL